MPERPTIEGDLSILGLTGADISKAISSGSNYDEKTELLHALIRSRRKELMRRHHPDVAGEAGLDRCQSINAACDRLLGAVRVGPPPRPQGAVSFQFGSGWTTSTTTSTTNFPGWVKVNWSW